MTNEEILQWIKEQCAAQEKQSNTRRRYCRDYPPLSKLLFKLRMIQTGKQIVLMREERGWSREQLAMRSKIKLQTLKQMERGKIHGVCLDDFSAIAHAFGCCVSIKFTSLIAEANELASGLPPESVPSFDEEAARLDDVPSEG